jgi:hypothetical protein
LVIIKIHILVSESATAELWFNIVTVVGLAGIDKILSSEEHKYIMCQNGNQPAKEACGSVVV